ncbi:hypothetical protein [Shimia sp.]|uniref:hypothetical protein n=1 Tax=Shimia sp. TaxID=1954381 RepID=UPI003566C106
MRILAAVLMLFSGVGSAAEWREPPRGSATRGAMMDALRPHAEWLLGAPVEFVVRELRQSGDIGFASLVAQRPGGGRIDIAATPGFRRGEVFDGPGDAREFHVLYRRSGATWVAVHWSSGATDVWFSWAPLCRQYRPVIAEVCGGQ